MHGYANHFISIASSSISLAATSLQKKTQKQALLCNCALTPLGQSRDPLAAHGQSSGLRWVTLVSKRKTHLFTKLAFKRTHSHLPLHTNPQSDLFSPSKNNPADSFAQNVPIGILETRAHHGRASLLCCCTWLLRRLKECDVTEE